MLKQFEYKCSDKKCGKVQGFIHRVEYAVCECGQIARRYFSNAVPIHWKCSGRGADK